jgi:polyferredoxin
VEVCPTGIDIRKGLQYECIGCAACVDTCDTIMDRMGYARGLVRYTTQNGLDGGLGRHQMLRRALRPRVLVYAAILLAVSVALLGHLALRTPLKVDVMRDRGALGREVEDGMIENVYRLQLINGAEMPRRLRLRIEGIPGIAIASEPEVEVPSAQPRLVAVRVRVPAGAAAPGSNRVEFVVEATDDPAVVVREHATFYVPR